MRFTPTDEQRLLADAIDDMAEAGGGAAIARSWAEGDHGPGIELWGQLGETGLLGIRISEDEGGVSGTLTDATIVFERLGYHGAPGPYLESMILLPSLVDPETREAIATGTARATASVDSIAPYAVDVDVSTHAFCVTADSIAPATAVESLRSIDLARSLSRLEVTGDIRSLDPQIVKAAIDETTLASAAFLLGAGERLLAEAVAYAKVREQFGHQIGEYQALKHAMADVRVALTFARPLIHGAALAEGSPTFQRGVSAAKVAASDAALKSAQTALQVHGAIGYTAEHDLRIWLLRVNALARLWGTPAQHRARIAQSLSNDRPREGNDALRPQ